MFRQSPSRNQRSKGFKGKHGLQICLLVAVCIWLLYQVKHSHDKKKAFDESNAEISGKMDNAHDIIKFGRKDLHPRVEEMTNDSENETHAEEEEVDEEEETKHEEDDDESKHEDEEGEESKHEEDEEDIKQEEDEEESKLDEEGGEDEAIKPEEIQDERGGGGDDEIDEQDEDKSEEEAEKVDDFVDEEEKDREDGDNQVEDVGGSDDQEHDRSTQEAREENYKRDDASSAVMRDTQVSTTEADNQNSANPNAEKQVKTMEENTLQMENKTNSMGKTKSDQNDSNQSMGASENIEGGNHSVNITASEETSTNGSETNISKTEIDEQLGESNKTHIAHSFVQKNVTDIDTGGAKEQIPETVTSSSGSDSILQMVVHDQTETSIASIQSDFNSTLATATENADVAMEEPVKSSVNSDAIVSEGKDNATDREEDTSESTTIDEKGNEVHDDKSDTTNKAEDVDDKSLPSTDDEILQEEKEARIDVETLPTTESHQGLDGEDAAAE